MRTRNSVLLILDEELGGGQILRAPLMGMLREPREIFVVVVHAHRLFVRMRRGHLPRWIPSTKFTGRRGGRQSSRTVKRSFIRFTSVSNSPGSSGISASAVHPPPDRWRKTTRTVICPIPSCVHDTSPVPSRRRTKTAAVAARVRTYPAGSRGTAHLQGGRSVWSLHARLEDQGLIAETTFWLGPDGVELRPSSALSSASIRATSAPTPRPRWRRA